MEFTNFEALGQVLDGIASDTIRTTVLKNMETVSFREFFMTALKAKVLFD